MVTEEEKKKLLQKNSNGNQNGGGRPTCERGEKTKQNKRNEAKRFFLRISRHWSTSSNFTVELIFKDFIKENINDTNIETHKNEKESNFTIIIIYCT